MEEQVETVNAMSALGAPEEWHGLNLTFAVSAHSRGRTGSISKRVHTLPAAFDSCGPPRAIKALETRVAPSPVTRAISKRAGGAQRKQQVEGIPPQGRKGRLLQMVLGLHLLVHMVPCAFLALCRQRGCQEHDPVLAALSSPCLQAFSPGQQNCRP